MNATLHIEADVHFDLSEGVRQFDDGNLENAHGKVADVEGQETVKITKIVDQEPSDGIPKQ